MAKYYLVDFENVGIKGLEGLEELSNDDYVHLFSTPHGKKLNSVTLERFNSVHLQMHNAPVKDQSVDKHLVSYLGYLLGKGNKSGSVIVISNDRGYDDIINFWKRERRIACQRSCSIKKALSEKAASNSVAAKVSVSKKNTVSEVDAKPAVTKASASQKNPVPKAATKPVASMTSPNRKNTEAKVETKPTLTITSAGQKNTATMVTTKPRAIMVPTFTETQGTGIEYDIRKALIKERYDYRIISYVEALGTEHYGKEGGKQMIYRSLIERYGPYRGRDIFHIIKKLL